MSEVTAVTGAMQESADDDQARCLYLMFAQIERGDMVLFDQLAAYGRLPRPAPRYQTALNFDLFRRLRFVCEDEAERAAWSGLLIGAAMRGDDEGNRLVGDMVRRRLGG